MRKMRTGSLISFLEVQVCGRPLSYSLAKKILFFMPRTSYGYCSLLDGSRKWRSLHIKKL